MKGKSVLNSFNALRGESVRVQIKSSLHILNHFLLKQKEYGQEECCEELQLGIERIVRGLGAPRANSRKGFFLTFVGLFELFASPTVTIQMCFDAIEKELGNFSSKTEENDICKGQILAYGGLIHSGKILEASHEEVQKIILHIITLSRKKSYLMLAGHTFLVDYIKVVDENVFKKSLWSILRDQVILAVNESKSLQWYNLLFVLNEKFPLIVDENFLTNVTGYPSVIHKKNLDSFGQSLLITQRNTTCIDSPTYQQILIYLANNEKLLKKVWLIVDERLSSATSVIIVHIFKLFMCCVQLLKDKNSIRRLLLPNFVMHLETKSDVVEIEEVRCGAIEKLSKIFSSKCVLSSKTQEELVQKLFFYPGSFSFLRDQGLKLFQSLLNDFSEETVKSVSKLFIDVLTGCSMKTVGEQANNETLQKPWKEAEKKEACGIMVRLMNHPKVNNCVDWKIEQMKVIIDIAFFSNLSPKFSKDVKICFYSALGTKFFKLTDLRNFLHSSVMYLNEKLQDDQRFSREFSKEIKKSWKKMIKTVSSIMSDSKGNTDNKKLTSTVFHVMFLLLGLTLFKEPSSAIENLKELHLIFKKMCSELKGPVKVDEDVEEEPHWTDVVVDLLLSLLSNSSRLNRNIISKVFVILCPLLTTQSIHQILNVLNPNTKNVMAAGQLTEMEDENESNRSLLKEQNGIAAGDSSDDDSDSAEDSNESLEESDLDDDTDYDKLRATIRDALGDAGAVTDTESVDLDDMDEEEGKRLNESLTEAFRQAKQQKLKTQSAEDKQLTDFRIRVLDLLEIWLKTSPELNLVFDTMVTALLLLENTLTSGAELQLQTKLKSFLKQLTLLNHFTNNERLEVKQLVELMKKLMAKDDKTASVYINMTPQIVECCTFILKISLRQLKGTKKMRPLLLDVYKDALFKFFNENNSIIPVGLFQSALNLPWEGSFDLIEDIMTYTLKPDVRPFYLRHAFNLLLLFMKNKRLLNEDNCNKYNNEIRQIASKLVDSVNILETKPDKFRSKFVQLCQSFKTVKCASDIIANVDITSLQAKRKRENVTPVKSKKRKEEKCVNEDELMDVETTNEEPVEKNVTSDRKVKGDKKSDKYKNALKLKKKRKIARSQELSKGIEDGIFGSHLFNNSAFIQGKIQNNEEEEDDDGGGESN